MGLIIPARPIWAFSSSSYPATPTTLQSGVAVTAGANNADGTAVAVVPTLTHDCEFLEIGISGFNATGTAQQVLMDILVDPAGGTTWSTLIADLLCGYTGIRGQTTGFSSCMYFFPLWIPVGSSLGAQARTSHTATEAGDISIVARGGNANPGSWWCGQSVETIGVDPSTSQGTLITPGNTGAYSSWVDLGAPTTVARHGGAVQFGVQANGAATNSRGFYVEFGIGGQSIGSPVRMCISTGESGCTYPMGVTFADIAAGAQLQARGTANGVNTDQVGCAAYIVS
jgi:hypothetical protein